MLKQHVADFQHSPWGYLDTSHLWQGDSCCQGLWERKETFSVSVRVRCFPLSSSHHFLLSHLLNSSLTSDTFIYLSFFIMSHVHSGIKQPVHKDTPTMDWLSAAASDHLIFHSRGMVTPSVGQSFDGKLPPSSGENRARCFKVSRVVGIFLSSCCEIRKKSVSPFTPTGHGRARMVARRDRRKRRSLPGQLCGHGFWCRDGGETWEWAVFIAD